MAEAAGTIILGLVAGAGVLVLILIAYLGLLQARRNQSARQGRIDVWRAWARAHGWAYREFDPMVARQLRGQPFQALAWVAHHVLYARHRGRDVVAFELPGADRMPPYVIVLLTTPASRPSLCVQPEVLDTELLSAIGMRDLQLESEEFNRAFLVTAHNERFAYDVLHPRMMEWLLADQRARSTPFQFEHQTLRCWVMGQVDPRNVLPMADYLVDVLEQVPSYVWK